MAEQDQPRDPLLELMLEKGVLDAVQAKTVEEEQARSGKSVREIVLHQGWIKEDPLLEIMARYLGTRVINLPAADILPHVIRSVTAQVARRYNVVPVTLGSTSIELAVFDLVGPQVMDELMFLLTRDVSFVMSREEDVRACINQFYGGGNDVSEVLSALESEIEQVEDSLSLTGEEEGDELTQVAESAPVIRFVNLVLYTAVNDRASDIHFEPFEKEFKIRYRVDGALYEMTPPPKRLAMPLISRVKVMANLNIAERRLPQDGRIQITIGGRSIDLRVSTLPTQFGESVVLRVLDRSVVSLEIENLGMPEEVYNAFARDIQKPHGIVIVTGPTGSGKTTTLYSGLRRINTTERKILTVEDPVEYDIEGIMQVPVNANIGNTFATLLRNFLRQDPDVMMVGEIRDLETAQIAIQAALTGHMVFSTLHTNDAAGAVTRLIDMEVPPYLISSTLEAAVGQRLVRVVCENCKTTYTPDKETLDLLGLSLEQVGGRSFCYGAGCSSCNETGYRGRKGVFEYLTVTEPVRELINVKSPTLIIREKAKELGMMTLREDGLRNILDGYTTVEEVMKYT